MENNTQNTELNRNGGNTVLPAGVSLLAVNAKWECCKCGWIGTHNESADKTPVVNDAWLLTCPKCGNKGEFYACR